MGCTGAGCLAALALLCRVLGDAPSRGKSPVPAPSGDPGADGRPWSPGRRGLFASAAAALGCERVPALSPCKESSSLRPGNTRLGPGKEPGSAVTVCGSKCGTPLSVLDFLLHSYFTEDCR